MPSIFDQYKPLRNLIRKFELIESLQVCWSMSVKASFGKPLPREFEVPPRINISNDPILFGLKVIHPWELEFLVTDILLNAERKILGKKYSLNKLSVRNRAVNYIRHLRDKMYTADGEDNLVFLELNRLAHQQFLWQSSYNKAYLYRYYKVFSFTGLSELIKETFNLSLI